MYLSKEALRPFSFSSLELCMYDRKRRLNGSDLLESMYHIASAVGMVFTPCVALKVVTSEVSEIHLIAQKKNKTLIKVTACLENFNHVYI